MGEGIGSILPDGWIELMMCLWILLERKRTNVRARRRVLGEDRSLAKIIQREKAELWQVLCEFEKADKAINEDGCEGLGYPHFLRFCFSFYHLLDSQEWIVYPVWRARMLLSYLYVAV